MAGLDAEPLTQPYDVLHASKQFQDWLSALEGASVASDQPSEPGDASRALSTELRAKLTVIMARQGGRRNFEALLK